MSIQIRNKFTVLVTNRLLTMNSGMTSLTPSAAKQKSITPTVAVVSARYGRVS